MSFLRGATHPSASACANNACQKPHSIVDDYTHIHSPSGDVNCQLSPPKDADNVYRSIIPAPPLLSKGRRPAAKQKQSGPKKKGGRKQNKSKSLWDNEITYRDIADGIGTAVSYLGKGLSLVLNTEEKVFDATATQVAIAAGAVTGLSLILQGIDYNQRNGISIRATRMRIDYLLYANATALQNLCRTIVFQDMDCRGVLPTIADLVEDTTNPLITGFNHKSADRFRVLYDKVDVIVATSNLVHRRAMIGLDSHVLYQGTTAAIGSAYEGNIFFAVLSDQGVNGPTQQLYSRVYFVDN